MTDATHIFPKSNRYVIMVSVILVVFGEAINYIISLLVTEKRICYRRKESL